MTRYNSGMTEPTYAQLESTWPDPHAVAALGSQIYVITGETLCEMSPTSEAWRRIDGDFRAVAIAGLGGALYLFEGSALLRIDTESGEPTPLPGTYADVRSAVELDDRIYVSDGEGVYAVSSSGDSRRLPGEWDNHRLVAGGDGRLYAFERNGQLYRVDPASGDATLIEGTWTDVSAAVSLGNRLYVFAGETLFAVDPLAGTWDRLSDEWETAHAVVCDGAIIAFSRGGTVTKISV